MNIILKLILNCFIFVILTILTQIGGVIYLLSKLLGARWKTKFRFKSSIIFIGLYILSTFLIIPSIAPIFGREKIKNSSKIKPTNYFTVLLNRNYVRPELNDLLTDVEKKLKNTPIEIRYLDANFPFINGFPLLPHLSHNDGKKIDLSLIYENKKGKIVNLQKSRSGYGVFEGPNPNEVNQIQECFDTGYFQYDYSKYLTFGKINNALIFSEKGTKELIESIFSEKNLGKLFIEPHLTSRLGLNDNRIRYHGCKAVRHDDHIHIQLK